MIWALAYQSLGKEKKITCRIAYSPVLCRHFLSWNSCHCDDSNLCQVDVNLAYIGNNMGQENISYYVSLSGFFVNIQLMWYFSFRKLVKLIKKIWSTKMLVWKQMWFIHVWNDNFTFIFPVLIIFSFLCLLFLPLVFSWSKRNAYNLFNNIRYIQWLLDYVIWKNIY